jgi:L-2-hydroxyglutarate oxidase LhgO
VTKKYAEIFREKFPQSRVLTGAEAKAFEHQQSFTKVITNKGYYTGTYIIACAGLQSDRIAKKEGATIDTAIVGFRGDYYDLSDKGMSKVKNLIYPVPNPQFPFLGVHFTRMIQGGVECGPNAVFVFKREGYGKTDFSLKDTTEAFGFGGTWKFFAKHWRFGIDEYRRAFINGWRAYEFGRNIYDCPHSSYDPIGIPLKREWEYGFTECHNSRQIPVPLPTDEDCYLEGWSTAQVGFPLNENPHPIGSHQSSMWDCGWNDFINEH